MNDSIELNPTERLECLRVAERLAPYYAVTGWHWHFRERAKDGTMRDVLRVPECGEIERTIASMALTAIRDARDVGKEAGCMSGGLRVISTPECAGNNPDEPNDPDNHLRFFVTVCP